jgi:hypothetical protein
MVDVSEFKAKEFKGVDNIMSGTKHPENIEVTRVDLVEFKQGKRAGTKGLVIEGKSEKGEMWAWFPNKTSVKSLAEMYGDESSKWLGKKVVFSTAKVHTKEGIKDGLFVKQ